ncbi:Rrf2 family transcriptional regulator [bacterium]|nr:Rrf2 family transcriptional regulator [bacterium]
MISVKSKYAVSVLLYMGIHEAGKRWRIQQLADACNVPKKYLEHILNQLRQDGILKSARGVNGGYFLEKRPSDIMIYDIVVSLEKDLSLARGFNGINGEKKFWQSVDLTLKKGLNVSLESLIQASQAQLMYTI